MKEKPIIFSGAMVRAILYGTKTQTRRIVRIPEDYLAKDYKRQRGEGTFVALSKNSMRYRACLDLLGYPIVASCSKWLNVPYQPGDLLWVREAFQHTRILNINPEDENYGYVYRADQQDWKDFEGWTWKPSIHMPREASRITLEVTAVRCERLQDISEADAIAEGIERFPTAHGKFVYENYRKDPFDYCDKALSSFASLWQSIHGPDSWNANPFVWVYEFRRVKP